VRDRWSYQLLTGLGIPAGKLIVTADSAFLLPPLKPAVKKEKKRKLVFAIRASRHLREDFPLILSQFVGELVADGWEVEFLAMQSLGVDGDPRFTGQLARNFPVTVPTSLEEVFESISSADAVIGMRLHSLIFAALAGVPFLGLSYSPKVSAFCVESGAADFLMPAEKISLRGLKRAFEKLLKEPPKISLDFLRERAAKNPDIFREFFLEGGSNNS